MKHIKTINELLKSTYLSASKKLNPLHPKRSNKLIDHAIKQGEDVTNHDRIYPHRFIFDRSHDKEYFSITEYSTKLYKDGSDEYLLFNTHMISNWGNKKNFKLIFQVYRLDRYNIEKPYLRFSYKSDKFENKDSITSRKNANHIFKFFKECWEDDIIKEYPDFTIEDLSVMYRNWIG